jgi:hypothetical protein
VYIIGMGIISWQGQFDGGAKLPPLNTGRIPLWWDIVVVAVFAVAIYIWAYFTSLPKDEILAIIGEQTSTKQEPELAG